MGETLTEIRSDLQDWIEAQRMFFVATAPSGSDGHVNCSPKGSDSFRVLDATTVAYLDYTGSGVETIAHVRDNGRIVVMFCAFEGKPKIVRLYGCGEVLRPDHEEFLGMLQRFGKKSLGVRAILRIHVGRVSTSCGYGVPFYDYVGERGVMEEWAEKKGHDGIVQYQQSKNTQSIDGLRGI